MLPREVIPKICEHQQQSNVRHVPYTVQKAKVMERSFCLPVADVFDLQYSSQQFQEIHTAKHKKHSLSFSFVWYLQYFHFLKVSNILWLYTACGKP